jgi:hypothetical protein
MAKYGFQVGKIVEDDFAFWSDEKPEFIQVKAKMKDKWDDEIVDPSDSDNVVRRRDKFEESLINNLSLMRAEYAEPIDETTKKFMLQDVRLCEVFSKEQIEQIAKKTNNLIRRAKKFAAMAWEGKPETEIKKDPEWFTAYEWDSFDILDKFIPPKYFGSNKNEISLDSLISEMNQEADNGKQ